VTSQYKVFKTTYPTYAYDPKAFMLDELTFSKSSQPSHAQCQNHLFVCVELNLDFTYTKFQLVMLLVLISVQQYLPIEHLKIGYMCQWYGLRNHIVPILLIYLSTFQLFSFHTFKKPLSNSNEKEKE